ncbi:hypothetical protein JW926_16195, partial [Candidatus Sumerlaeota bacterium]|nr:hypothetical protein [Candidatus Sumerlaeota bacterium]
LGDRGDSEHSQIQMNKEFYLVGVEKIQILIGENWVDINKPNVFLNKDIGYSFRAVRHPSNVPWPDGNPVWTGAYNGTGEVASVTINQYGNFPLSVYCGASGKGVILWTYYVGVAPEENLEECMEGRPVTYYATIYPANVPVSSSDMCTFTFYFRTAMGVNWEGITYSTTRYGNYTAVACQVPDGSPGHMFTTPIHVDAAIGYAKAVSPTIFVDVYELWIDNPTSYKHVDYGTDFNSTSIHSNDCHGYLWSMPDGWPDAWALGGSINNDSGNLYVKEGESSLLGDSTTLKLECEDGEDRNHHDTKTVFVDGIYAVTAVKFDFDPASDQDGQNARINAADDITPPEWICPPTPNPNFPAVYVGNKTGMLQAKFAFTYGKSGKSFKVYANGNGEGALGGKGPLGDLNETLVDNDDYKTFTTKQSTPDVIKKQGMYFDWYFKSSTHADVETLQPKEINETGNHQIYIVAYPPEDPFNGSGSGDGVWTILLDVLCDDDWCEGMSIILNSDIVSKITQNTNESGFTYDTVHGAPSFVPGWYYFELTGCLSDWGSTTVNCSDCAYITSIYARALGIDPNLLRIKSYSGGYLLNWIKPIGCAWTNNPFNSNPRTGFSFHHVSTFPSDEKIYDACLDLDGDTSPTTQPNTVLKVLGLSYSSIYKQKLVAPEDISDIYEDNFPVLSLVNIY